jgi:polyisoprenyl-phosphate glycosyltransferase
MVLVSIVVPVYNNATSLPSLLARFQTLAAGRPQASFEFVFVDDGSQDESCRVIEELIGREPRACLVRLSRNFGSSAAVLAGLEQAKGDAVAAIAADLQDPPELIGEMLARWAEGHKVVLAARETRADPWFGTLLANTFYTLFRRFAIRTMPKRGFDFFLIDRQVRDLVIGIQENHAYLMGLILWTGFSPEILYYRRAEREKRFGRSMWTFAKKVHYFIDAFVGFSYTPLRAASAVGVLCCGLGFVYAAIVAVRRLCYGADIQGWASLMVVLLFVSGVQMLIMGVLGEYLCRNLEETRRRPRFVRDYVVEGSQTGQRRAEGGDHRAEGGPRRPEDGDRRSENGARAAEVVEQGSWQ